MFGQFRSVALRPIRSAAAWPISCISELVLQTAAPNSAASRALGPAGGQLLGQGRSLA
jgi:hypothetical protein